MSEESDHPPEESDDLSDVSYSERVREADQWSKFGALLVAIVVFSVGYLPTGETLASSNTGAFAGIGARFVVPYYMSQTVPEEERVPIEDHPGTGNFHHGAVGSALVIGPVVATVVMIAGLDSTLSLLVGGVAGGVVYFPLKNALPRG